MKAPPPGVLCNKLYDTTTDFEEYLGSFQKGLTSDS